MRETPNSYAMFNNDDAHHVQGGSSSIANVGEHIKKGPQTINKAHSTNGFSKALHNEVTESPTGHLESDESTYIGMGQALLERMRTFNHEMRANNNTSPSTKTDGTSSLNEKGEEARRQVVKLAEEILASTIEPRLNLLVSSLQVFIPREYNYTQSSS